MTETEVENAFQVLAHALTTAESEIHEEIEAIKEQIVQLKERIIELNTKKETLSHDSQAVKDMYNRYSTGSD